MNAGNVSTLKSTITDKNSISTLLQGNVSVYVYPRIKAVYGVRAELDTVEQRYVTITMKLTGCTAKSPASSFTHRSGDVRR